MGESFDSQRSSARWPNTFLHFTLRMAPGQPGQPAQASSGLVGCKNVKIERCEVKSKRCKYESSAKSGNLKKYQR